MNVDKKIPKKTRIDVKVNSEKVRLAIWELIKEKKRNPTYSEVCEKVGMQYKTIKKHYEKLKFEPQKSIYRSLTPDVILAIAKSALRGSTGSQRLWLQVMEGWSETFVAEVNQKVLNVNVNIDTKEAIARLKELEALKND